tara:strand:- start:796 stop:978 length:183 start_codon:yes stop_codon:yes gene_type:complete
MPYIYLNKQTNILKVFGSIKALCISVDLKVDNFYTHFGRKGNTEFENDSYRIVKTEIERS